MGRSISKIRKSRLMEVTEEEEVEESIVKVQ
jgi:hypothetical protein